MDVIDEKGIASAQASAEDWLNAIREFLNAKHKKRMSSSIAEILSLWAKHYPAVLEAYVLPSQRRDATTLLLSVVPGTADTKMHWAANEFALVLGNGLDVLIDVCIVEGEFEKHPGYIFAYRSPQLDADKRRTLQAG
jgi:hypothetical protein